MTRDLTKSVCRTFEDNFGSKPIGIAIVPGRVNLIGEHTDYNEGFVFPMAIDYCVLVAFAPNTLNIIRAHSVWFGENAEKKLSELRPTSSSSWFDYIGAVAWAMKCYGICGIDLVVDSNLPSGVGLSSSAAVEIAVARSLAYASELPWDPIAMSELAQKAENEYIGVNCGIMDQLAVTLSQEGSGMLIDCRDLQIEFIKIPAGLTFVVLESGAVRAVAQSEYNERRRSCERALQFIKRKDSSIKALRDLDVEFLLQFELEMDPVVLRRAKHVINESIRTQRFGVALKKSDFKLAGQLMNESHESLKNLYNVSTIELDRLTERARMHPSCWGAKLTGAGFGGSAVALVDSGRVNDFISDFSSTYKCYVCRPVNGASLLLRDEFCA